MLRGRTSRSYTLDLILVIILLALVYVYVTNRMTYNPNAKKVLKVFEPDTGKAFKKNHASGLVVNPDTIPKDVSDWDVGVARRRYLMADPKHDIRLKNIPDTRPSNCASQTGKLDKSDAVSIVVNFYEYQYYDMKTTVNSVLLNTDLDLVDSIVVVDDASSQDFIKKDVDVFSSVAKKVKLVRLTEKGGPIHAMVAGFNHASTEKVVYLQPGVIVNKGWLEPLIKVLKEKANAVVTPHYDSVNDPIQYDYKKTADNLTPIFTWGMGIRMVEVDKAADAPGSTLPIVVLRGSAFAVNKKFLKDIGSFDTDFPHKMSGGQFLEFSFRTWRCGGVILEAPCSRVGVLNLDDPVKIVSHPNIRRIVELWMRKKGDTIYHSTGTSANLPKAERLSLLKRQEFLASLKLTSSCKDVKWFFSEIAKYVPRISESTLQTGVLRCKTSSCVQTSPEGKLLLGSCAAIIKQRNDMFEFLTTGHIAVRSKCLEPTKNMYIQLTECEGDKKTQQWEFTQVGEIRNKETGMCAMHVTDPDKSKNKRQIMMVQVCEMDTEGTFKTWQFVPI